MEKKVKRQISETGPRENNASIYSSHGLDWMSEPLLCEQKPKPFMKKCSHEAIRICMECDYRAECLEYSFDIDQDEGIVGGLDLERRKEIYKTWCKMSLKEDKKEYCRLNTTFESILANLDNVPTQGRKKQKS